MRTNNLQELIETRAQIEFVVQVLKLMAQQVQNGENIELLSFMLLQMHETLEKATTKIFEIESEETEDDLAEVDNGSKTA